MATLDARLKALEAGADDEVIVILPNRPFDDTQPGDSTEPQAAETHHRGYERIVITNPRDFD